MLIDFWEEEIDNSIEESEDDMIFLKQIIKNGEISFFHKYGFPHPYMIMYEPNDDYDFLYLKSIEPKASYDNHIYDFIRNRVIQHIKHQEFWLKNDSKNQGLLFNKENNSKEILINLVKEKLFLAKDKTLLIKKLASHIDRMPLPKSIIKPIPINDYVNFFKKHSLQFHLDNTVFPQDGSVRFNDYTKEIINKSSWNSFAAFKEIPNDPDEVIMFKYTGESFPFAEATEYAKIRHVLFISTIRSLKFYYSKTRKKYCLDYNSDLYNKIIALRDDFFSDNKYKLETFVNIHSWIEQNIEYAIVDKNKYNLDSKSIVADFILFNSPILNTSDNVANPFAKLLHERLLTIK